MVSSVLLCGALILGWPYPDGPAIDLSDRQAYETAAAGAGHDATTQVRLALWCEALGLSAERLQHLTRAVLDQPSNVLARSLLGLVRYQGRWEQPDAVAKRVRDDTDQRALIREYLERRARTAATPDAQARLAAWCESNGLKDQALAHYHEVLRLDPARKTVWKHLGYIKQGNRWVKPEQLAAEKQETIRQKQADQLWRTKLAKLRDDLQSKDVAKRARAEQALGDVTDPRAVGAIWAVFVGGGERYQMSAIQMFGQTDGPSASSALAAMAILSPWPEVRGRAIETLVRRDPRDLVGRLVDLVHKPHKYEMRPVGGPGSPGELFIEGERFNIQRLYENQTTSLAPRAGRIYTPDVPFDPFSAQNLMLASGAWATNQVTLTRKGFEPSGLALLDPSAVAQAANRMAVNPQNAVATLDQLVHDPNNRVVRLPPGYSISVPLPPSIHLGTPTETSSGAPTALTATPSQIQSAEGFARQLRAQGNDPLSLWGMALRLQNLQNGHPNAQSALAGSYMVQAQSQIAAQRDIEIGQELAQAQQINQNLQQQLVQDVQFIEWINEGFRQTNQRVLPVLIAITGVDLGSDGEAWKRWWLEQLDNSAGSRTPGAKLTYRDQVNGSTGTSSTMVDAAASQRMPIHADAAKGADPAVSIRACFAAGTQVQTRDGPRPIESLEVGAPVLCQDVTTGELDYQPVLSVYSRKPSPVLRISAGGESIVATSLQRFWKCGKGWTMARDLKAGDRLRIVGGVAAITSIKAVPPQPVYNVDVAENRDLFVGARGFLVHDFWFVPSVPEPFDRQAEPAATATARSRGRLAP